MPVKNNWVNGETLGAADLNTLADAVNDLEGGGVGEGGGANLTVSRTSTTVTVASDTGTDAALPAADGSNAGVMTSAMQIKLAGVSTGATANDTDANLKARANHTGTQTASTISDFSAAVDARVAAGITGKADLASPTFTGTVAGITKTMVGLGSVDNTADADKPVSTATQTALGAKADKTVTTNTQTASYTLVLSDAGKAVEMNVASANNLTVPPNSSVAFPTGTVIEVGQLGAGQTTVVADSGVTIRSASGLKLRAQYSVASIRKRASDEWWITGDTTT
jgi:hypothetical protein